MIVCRNISSGRSFIYIKDIDWEKIQVITPLNQIRILERRLFEDEVDGVETDFLSSGAITASQLKVYHDYKNLREAEDKEFVTGIADVKLLPRQSDDSYQPGIQERRGSMKGIEIDDEVYAYLQSQAVPFEEPTPNHVIRRLLGLDKRSKPKKPSTQTAHSTNGSKAPSADLRKLVQLGILREGQKLILNYKGMLSKDYEVEIVGDRLLYQGKIYKMSSLVADILDQEGCGIPSRSYRGPEYWHTSDGISVRQLWERHLKSGQ